MRPGAAEQGEVSALLPAGDDGHQFVVYGDSCSGRPGFRYEQNFAQVNRVVRRIRPEPEFICFVGDHVMGGVSDSNELRKQWQYWLNQEMAWLDRKRIPLYSTTSNHNTYSKDSELVFREILRTSRETVRRDKKDSLTSSGAATCCWCVSTHRTQALAAMAMWRRHGWIRFSRPTRMPSSNWWRDIIQHCR
jgi:hypothetical protein